MTAQVLPFPKARRVVCAGPTCIKQVQPRQPGNDPAYCSYGCGTAGQPDKVQMTLRRQRDDADNQS